MNSDDASWPKARQGMFQIVSATVAFALWHSLLCSLPAKQRLTPLLQKRGVTYRLFFMVQSAVTFGALLGLIFTRPTRTIYRFTGALKLLFLGLQALCAIVCAWSVLSLSPKRFFFGRGEVEPEAQGPELTGEGKIEVSGPFRWSRHALEWFPILTLFFTPHLKTNWLAFNLLGAIYSVVGAIHEEKRLDERGGAAYARYKKQVGFWFGRSNESE